MKRKSAGTWQEHAPGYYEPPPTSFEQDPEEPPEEEPDLYGEYLLGDKELQAYLESRGFAVYAHEDTEDLRTAANLDKNLLKGLDICSACQGAGLMDGAVCAHCEDEDESDADEAHAEDAWEARQAAREEDEDIARDKRRWPEEADFE